MNRRKKIFLAQPRGFCAGVRRALDTVEKTLEVFGPPVYVRHEIVHNDYVVETLQRKGVVFIEELSDAPVDRPVIFSAHGVSPHVEKEARKLGLMIIDATCPLVKKIHRKAQNLDKENYTIIIIGHKEHPEIAGTMGHIKKKVFIVETLDDVETLPKFNSKKLACLTQTTLSMDDTKNIIDALRKKYPELEFSIESDICYATQNRQNAIKSLAEKCDVIFILGSESSSNSNRLREVAEKHNAHAYLISNAESITENMLKGCEVIGISAGASAPEIIVKELISFLQDKGWNEVETLGVTEENVVFPLPEFSVNPLTRINTN